MTEVYYKMTLLYNRIYHRVCYGSILRDYMMEAYYGIILMTRIRVSPGSPRSTLRPPGDPRARCWDVLGRRAWDPWEPPRNRKTPIPQQKHSARSSPLLHPNPFGCNAWSQRLPWTVLSCILQEWSPFWSAPGPPQEATSSQEGMDAHRRKGSAHEAPGPGSPFLCYYIICIVSSHLLPYPECALWFKTMSAVPHSRHHLLCCAVDMSAA